MTHVARTSSWQTQLGPFAGRTRGIAAVTLFAFVHSVLHASIASAMAPTRQVARDAGELQLSLRGPEAVAPTISDELESRAPSPAQSAPSPVALSPAGKRELAANVGQSGAQPTQPSGAGTGPSVTASLALTTASAPVAAQAISLPSGAATVSGMGESFSAQLTTGIATFNLPFAFPPARGGAQPALSLVYGSSGGFGDAGVGWSLAGGVFIARQTDRGTPRYDDRPDYHPNQDRFIFGAQELVPICTVTGGVCAGALAGELFPKWAESYQYFRARIEGTFLRFFWSLDHRTWRIQSKDGLHFELGAPLDASGYTGALEANPTRPAEIYRWHLVRQYDSHGDADQLPLPLPTNPVVYRYREDGAIRYLSDVYYTSPASDPRPNDAAFAHHLRVDWESRPDRVSSYRAGFLQEQKLRLQRLEISSKPFGKSADAPRELVRRYHVGYEPRLHTSLLASVQLEGRCVTPIQEDGSGMLAHGNCPRLPQISFGYQRVTGQAPAITDSSGLAFEPLSQRVEALGDRSPPRSLDEAQVALMDIDADGLPDFISTAAGLYQGKHALFLNGASGELGFGPLQRMAVTGVASVDESVLTLGNPNVSPLDPDGDGTINLLHMPAVKRYSVFSPQRTATGFAWVGREITTAQNQDPKIDFTRRAARVARVDVNADGLVDLVYSGATELQTFFALGRFPGGDTQFGRGAWTSSTTADLSTEPVTTCLPWSAQAVGFDDPQIRMADMNGDGLPDIVRLRSGQVLYWPGRGNGFWGIGERDNCAARTFGQDRHVKLDNAPRFGATPSGGLELGDVNGDGLADVVEFRGNAVDVYLNENGQRMTDRQTLTGVPIKGNTSRFVQIADLNGSGTPDLVWGQGRDYRYIDLTGGVQPYLLTRVDNGLGKVTELEYASSTRLMLAARKAGAPWARTLPMSTQVVVKSTVRDQLEKVGRSGGAYVTEYEYRDPFFDGRQREFRGFETATSRVMGDATAPSVSTRSTFLLGECRASQAGLDVCSPSDRWRDNWREPLKGLPAVVETFDDTGAYLSTAHQRYELRQLYAGRDGRRVSVALSVGQDTFGYDTAPFTPGAEQVALEEVKVKLADVQQTDARSVTRRSRLGTVRLRSSATFDNYGSPQTQVAEGCVEGCLAVDEAITQNSEIALVPGAASAWLFRPSRTFVTGSVRTARRAEMRYTYTNAGDLERSFATLSGTLRLDRRHASGGAVAPGPVDASAGVDAPIEIQSLVTSRDAFGNVKTERAPLGRCREMSFDATYADLPVTETTFGGPLNAATGCGERSFTTRATYDRGLQVVVTSQDVSGQPARFELDGFGRLTAKYFVDPDRPGQLAVLPSATYDYELTTDPSARPYSVIVAHDQDALKVGEAQYHDAYLYIDGLGRTLATLSEADPLEGDGGDFVVGGITRYGAKGNVLRAYESFFWSGEPLEFPVAFTPPKAFVSQTSDAFGRPVYTYGLDGQAKAYQRYHALSRDVFDALDLEPGPRQGTYTTVLADGHGRTIQSTERVRLAGVKDPEERVQLTERLPTGEVTRFTQRRAGSPDVVRWLRYDSQGRMVLNVEPNTTQNFSPNESTKLATFRALRYAYNDVGELVGTSDARGCGVNYFRDTAGRLTAEDYSPCQADQAPYSPPDFSARTGIETLYQYDVADASLGAVVNEAGTKLAPNTALYFGRAVSVSDRGSRGVVRYDARGRITGGALQIAKPGGANDRLADRYAPRWYLTETKLDAPGRPLQTSTGVTTAELLGQGDKSLITTRYTERGVAVESDSSYGLLSTKTRLDADGRLLSMQLGDAAKTQRAFGYDDQRRLKTAQTYRASPNLWSTPAYPTSSEKTQQLLLEDTEVTYDAASNVTALADFRVPDEWPDSAKPVSRQFEYDDLYRLIRSTSQYAAGTDTWTSPHAPENAGTSDAPKPSPHVDFPKRIQEQRYQYDHLGNLTQTTDDAGGFFDRSLGAQQHGIPYVGPHQLVTASSRVTAATSTRKGDLETKFDPAGNLTDLVVRRDGPCLPAAASCWQRYRYAFDELGRLDVAKRWDLAGAERTNNDAITDPLPPRAPQVELRHTYDSGGNRVLKTAVDPTGNQSHTVYITSNYELRRTWWSNGDYVQTPDTVTVYVSGGGVRGRVIYSQKDLPGLTSGKQHLLLELSDYLGSTTSVIDHATGELVEYSTYQPYGGAESDYRPARWGQFREAYKFTGKEEDVEVGLAYFGARFLVIGLNRWASPDPVTIHQLRGDANPYAYVGGRPMIAVDPDGRELITLAIIVGVSLLVSMGTQVAAQWDTSRSFGNNLQKGFANMNWAAVGANVTIGLVSGGVGSAVTGLVGTQILGATGAATLTTAQAAVAAGLGGLAAGATSYGLSLAASHNKFVSPQGPMQFKLEGLALATGVAGLAAGAGGALAPASVTQASREMRAWMKDIGWTKDLGAKESTEMITQRLMREDAALARASQNAAKVGGEGAGGGLRPMVRSLGAAGDDVLLKKAVNSNLPHAVERGVERGVFGSADEAATALRSLTDQINEVGTFPSGTLVDTANAGRFLVPTGNNGLAVYQLANNGTAKLKTVLIAR